MRVLLRVREEAFLSLDCELNVLLRHLGLLLRETVGKNYGFSLVEEVEQAVVDASVFRAKLVDVISEVIGLRTQELVAEFAESFDANDAFVLGRVRQTLEPSEKRDTSILLSVEHYPCSRHSASSSVAILRPTVKPGAARHA